MAEVAEQTLMVKGSRFVAVVAPLERPEGAQAWIDQIRAREADAHHVAWAIRFASLTRFSDDGEPGGTAGRPILEVLVKRDVDRVVAIVARVFGGVKLGAGGLVRAYGGAVARALDGAAIAAVEDRRGFFLTAPFALSDALLRLLAPPAVEHDPPQFAGDGLRVRGSVLASAADAFADRVRDLSRGRAVLTWRDDP